MSKLSLSLFDDGPPPGWTKSNAKAKRKKPAFDPPDVFSWKVRLYMNDGSTRFFNLGRITYTAAAKRRDDLLAGADAYKAWLDRGIA